MAAGSARSQVWKRVRDEVLADATVCHLCGGFLDFDAPARSRWSPSVDHVVPVSRAARLGVDGLLTERSNLRPAHLGCNSSRGSRGLPRPRRQSRAW